MGGKKNKKAKENKKIKSGVAFVLKISPKKARNSAVKAQEARACRHLRLERFTLRLALAWRWEAAFAAEAHRRSEDAKQVCEGAPAPAPDDSAGPSRRTEGVFFAAAEESGVQLSPESWVDPELLAQDAIQPACVAVECDGGSSDGAESDAFGWIVDQNESSIDDTQFSRSEFISILNTTESTIEKRHRLSIFCEGIRTEPLYLQGLMRLYGVSQQCVEYICGFIPERLFEKGIDRLHDRSCCGEAWLVCDRDDHHAFADTVAAVKKTPGLHIAPSFLCIETWFMMHYPEELLPQEQAYARLMNDSFNERVRIASISPSTWRIELWMKLNEKKEKKEKKETKPEKWLRRIKLATGFKYSKTEETTAQFLAERLAIAFDLCRIQASEKLFLYQDEVFWSGMPSLIIRLLKQRRIDNQNLSEEDRRRFIAFDLLFPAGKKNLKDFVLKELKAWIKWVQIRPVFIEQLKNESNHWAQRPGNPMDVILKHDMKKESSSDANIKNSINDERAETKEISDAFWIAKIAEVIGLNREESHALDNYEILQEKDKSEIESISLQLFEMLRTVADSVRIIEENADEMLTRATSMHDFLLLSQHLSLSAAKLEPEPDAGDHSALNNELQPSDEICLYEATDNQVLRPFSAEEFLCSRLDLTKLFDLDNRSSFKKENEYNSESEYESNSNLDLLIGRMNNSEDVVLISRQLKDAERLLSSFVSRNKIRNCYFTRLKKRGLSLLDDAQNLLRQGKCIRNIWIVLSDEDEEISEVLQALSNEHRIRCILMKNEKDLKFLGFFVNNLETSKFLQYIQNLIFSKINLALLNDQWPTNTDYPSVPFSVASHSIVRSLRKTSNGQAQICADFSEEDLLKAIQYAHLGSWGKLPLRWASVQKSEDFLAWAKSYAPSKRLPGNVHTLLALFSHLLRQNKTEGVPIESAATEIKANLRSPIQVLIEMPLLLTYSPK